MQDNNEKSTSLQHRFQSIKKEIPVMPRPVFEEVRYFRSFLHFSTSTFRARKFSDVKKFANGRPFQKFSQLNFSITNIFKASKITQYTVLSMKCGHNSQALKLNVQIAIVFWNIYPV